MLQIRNISKKYITGSLEQMALDGVSLDLRDNEFVAILGPSGSGKTTLLNIIGGLDRYDSGDLIINGITTKKYKDRDWDSYRNHTVGFVFQSYNLIPHQSVLANVELALTISGISRAERKRRAQEALTKVGLAEHIYKKPNQLSGGQMQRVAIARALVNDPDILLADEPTGALDSETSVQVMDLLKEVAKDRLVVMVTHNPELAEEYANRIVRLKDGKIISDSNPFDAFGAATATVGTEATAPLQVATPVHKNMGKASMSFLTALSLSLNNLLTKKARTILVAFAGSIGIIGIALILALSNGVNKYIADTEEETLSEYPIQISRTSFDLASFMGFSADNREESLDTGEGEVQEIKIVSDMFSSVESNDLAALKAFLDSKESRIHDYARAVEYSYNITPWIYRKEGTGIRQVSPDQMMGYYGMNNDAQMMMGMSMEMFSQLPEDENLYKSQYQVLAGHWPESSEEAVLVLTGPHHISDYLLYTLGLKDAKELDEMMKKFADGQTVAEERKASKRYNYEDFLGIEFRIIPAYQKYSYESKYKLWTDKSSDKKYMRTLFDAGKPLVIKGVVTAKEDATASMLSPGIAYTDGVIFELIEGAQASEIVKSQQKQRKYNVLTGKNFGDEDNNPFDMESIFTVNEEAFANAFSFDANALSLDLSALENLGGGAGGMPQGGMNLDPNMIANAMPELSQADLEKLLKGVEIDMTQDEMQKIFETLIADYQKQGGEDVNQVIENVNKSFEEYLRSEDFQSIVTSAVEKYITDNASQIQLPEITQEEATAMLGRVMSGFNEYITEYISGLDPAEIPSIMANFEGVLMGYFESETGQQLLQTEIENLRKQIMEQISEQMNNPDLPPFDTDALSKEVIAGYQKYAAETTMPEIQTLSESFQKYLAKDSTRKLLQKEIGKAIDSDDLEKQLQKNASELIGQYADSVGTQVASQIGSAMEGMMSGYASEIQSSLTSAMSQLGTQMENAFSFNPDALAEAFSFDMSEKELEELFTSMMTKEASSYEGNLRKMGFADLAEPNMILLYPRDFESKEGITGILEKYNQDMEDSGQPDKAIRYTDIVGTLMSSVTKIINSISYVLIAFVAISLVVSSIMIGVITYISVLERRKEIGILRAIGASKRNISSVFNAETFIIGFLAGLFGVVIARLLLIPGNFILHTVGDTDKINAVLPISSAIILIVLSIVLTLIGGLIPSRKAAKSDPVTALRTE